MPDEADAAGTVGPDQPDTDAASTGRSTTPSPIAAPTAVRAPGEGGQRFRAEPAASEGPRFRAARRELRAFAELFALSGFAIAQPLLDVFGKAPDRFVFRGATSLDIWVFALLAIVAVPLALWLVELIVQVVHGRARRGLHLGFITMLVAAFAIQALRPLASGPVLMAVAGTIGALVALLYVRARAVQVWLSVCAAAPPVFAVLFLVASPTSQLLSDTNTLGIVPASSRAPVVLMVFDELPLASLIDADGTIDAELFPNFAALADDSHWFRNTTTVSNFTWNAVPSIVTGMLPKNGESPVANSHPKNIFTLLGESLDLKVTESVTRLCPASLCSLDQLDQGGLEALIHDARQVMNSRLVPNPPAEDPVAGNVEVENVEDLVKLFADEPQQDDRSRRFIDGLDGSSDTLHFLHILLPHVPFQYLPDGSLYNGPTPDLGREGDNWLDQPALVQLGRQRHLLQLGYADRMLGQAIQAMKDAGFYDDAVIAVVADHGTSFLPGQEIRSVDISNDDPSDEVKSDIMWVPFFVKEPGQTNGSVSDADVRTIDVLPTIADVLNLTLPWTPDGRSALGPERTGQIKEFHRSKVDGSRVLTDVVAQLDEERGYAVVLDHAVDRFLTATGDPQRWWKVGSNADLVGTSVGRIRGAGTALTPATSSLTRSSKVDDVDPSSGIVPNLLTASTPELAAGTEVVVAVNGTVWASTEVYDLGSGSAVAAIVPTEAFVPGSNDVQVYVVS